jgi:hypothetical protein
MAGTSTSRTGGIWPVIVGGASLLGAANAVAQRLGLPSPIFPGGGGTDGPGWSDNFDSYATGSQLLGQGGFSGWVNYPANNPTALISNAVALSTPNSCRLALANPGASPATDQTDLVRQYTITGGHWVFRVNTYMPSSAVATGTNPAPYFMLLNSYPAASWSVQVHFEKNLGRVLADRVGGPGGTGGGLSDPPVALILDQWVELVVDLNLDAAPNGSYSVTYGGAPLITGGDWKAGSSPPFSLQAMNLYDAATDVFYFDNASLSPATATCYPNCDLSTTAPCLNVLDFACFLNKFAAGDTYANCDHSTSNPILNVLDFACFLNSFASGCSSC